MNVHDIFNKGRHSALGHALPWTISFFLNEKKINIFRLMYIVLFSSDLLSPNFVEKNHIL